MRKKALVVKVKPSKNRIIESIIVLISEADRLKKSASQYDLVKSVFLADRRHLNEYGRPITFDHYVAMAHGPVPSTTYDILKGDPKRHNYPWSRNKAEQSIFNYSNHTRDYDCNVLSPSDVEFLEEAFITVKSLGFSQIRKLTHEDPAYVDAWEEDSTRSAFDISYAMLFDVPNPEKARDIAFASENI